MSSGRTGARIAAFRLLREVARGEYADRAASRALADLPPRDRALAREIGFGVLRLRARLDAELAVLADRPLRRLQPEVLAWLRVGLYQIRESRVPAHAAVHESVEGLRHTAGGRAAGFVNAVLRRAAAAPPPPGVFPPLEADPVGHLSTYGSHPEWLVRRWLFRWPLATVARLVENDNRPPPVVLRVVREPESAATRGARAGWPERDLEALGLEALDDWPGLYRLADGDLETALVATGGIVQDPAASAVVDYVGSEARGPAIDACAAPGGKAVALAALARDARPFVAGDASRRRLERLEATRRRLGADLRIVALDARRPPLPDGWASTVLLDVPCMGTGVLRRRPDARWRLEPGRLESLAVLQTEILEAGARLVAPGGLLVYATCSLEPEENEERIDGFLAVHPEYRRDDGVRPATLPEDVIDERGDLVIRPWVRGTDGAFASRLRREAAA
ncbi:MAG: transcription antitermination factor NusB [Gemmatimonadota bacterium]